MQDIDEFYAKVESSDISTTPLVEQPVKRPDLSLSKIRIVLNDPCLSFPHNQTHRALPLRNISK